jgi:type I restriction enzyme S subunit
MEVKPGYKQTEVGVIPEDWDLVSLGDNATKIGSGITPTGGERVYKNEGHPFLRSQNVGWGYLLMDDIAFIDDETHSSFKATEIEMNDVFLNITGASIGRSAVADEHVVGGNVNQHVCIIRTKSDHLDHIFLNQFLLSSIGQKQIDSFQAGGNRQGLNFGQIRSFRLPLPPLPEQGAIAAALSGVEALITTLDKLIAKKRDIKQAAMQELLIGRRRLPGFSGEWVVKRLGDSSTLKARIGWQGLTTAEYLDSGDYYLVTGTEFKNSYIDWSNCHFVDESRYKQDKNIQLKEQDVLVTKDGTIGKVALITNLPKPATLNSGVFVIRPIDNAFHPKFLYYLLCSNAFTDFLVQLSAGSTINHLYQKDFVSFTYKMPATIDEQTAIANVLSDMDAEITVLEARRDKTKVLKQGMMQELLTGRIRLVEGGAA